MGNLTVLTKWQKKEFKKIVKYDGVERLMCVEIRHDDECGNGHNTFSITGDIYKDKTSKRDTELTCGCIHEEIAKYFPELEKYIKYHLVSTDQPMHYFANTLYLAGDKDCNGKRKGEVLHTEKRLYFKNFPIQINASHKLISFLESVPNFSLTGKNEDEAQKKRTAYFNELVIRPLHHKPDTYNYSDKYTFIPNVFEWHEGDFDTEKEAIEFLQALKNNSFDIVEVPTSYSQGKEPELEAARSTAIAPEATLEQLQSREWLETHLKKIMVEFQTAVEELGFIY